MHTVLMDTDNPKQTVSTVHFLTHPTLLLMRQENNLTYSKVIGCL